jgi:hypothetical protein
MGKAAALSVVSSLYIQAESKYIKAPPSQPKPRPNFSKEKAWISFTFMHLTEPKSYANIIGIGASSHVRMRSFQSGIHRRG